MATPGETTRSPISGHATSTYLPSTGLNHFDLLCPTCKLNTYERQFRHYLLQGTSVLPPYPATQHFASGHPSNISYPSIGLDSFDLLCSTCKLTIYDRKFRHVSPQEPAVSFPQFATQHSTFKIPIDTQNPSIGPELIGLLCPSCKPAIHDRSFRHHLPQGTSTAPLQYASQHSTPGCYTDTHYSSLIGPDLFVLLCPSCKILVYDRTFSRFLIQGTPAVFSHHTTQHPAPGCPPVAHSPLSGSDLFELLCSSCKITIYDKTFRCYPSQGTPAAPSQGFHSEGGSHSSSAPNANSVTSSHRSQESASPRPPIEPPPPPLLLCRWVSTSLRRNLELKVEHS